MRARILGVLFFATLIAVAAWQFLYWGEDLQAAEFAYPARLDPDPAPSCAAGDPSAHSDDLPPMLVRAPRNYRDDHAHGLLVVFSPAGFGPGLTERYMGLTHRATRSGAIVVYVASGRLGPALAARLAHVPDAVARNWCIDASRIVFAGHSDGGTLSQVVALQAAVPGALRPKAIVASGAGLIESDFGSFDCSAAGGLDVLIVHGRNDRHFPDYGASAVRGWSRCLGCRSDPVPDAPDCAHHAGCRGHLRFCQHDGRHWIWPGAFRQSVVDALD